MNNQYQNFIKDIKKFLTNNELKFAHPSMENLISFCNYEAQYYHSAKCTSRPKFEQNYIHDFNGDKHYYTKGHMDHLYKQLLDKPTQKDTSSKTIHTFINKSLDKLLQETRSNTFLNITQELIIEKDLLRQALYNEIFLQVLYTQRDKASQNQINKTAFCIRLGKLLLQVLFAPTAINPIINLNNQKYLNNNEEITTTTINEFIQTISTNNLQETTKIITNLIKPRQPLDNKTLQILSTYILSMVYENYSRNNLDITTIEHLLELNTDPIEIKNQLTEHMLKIGNILLEYLRISEDGKEIFTEELKHKSKNKSQWKIQFKTEIIEEFTRNNSIYIPKLYDPNSFNNEDNIEDYIAKNPSLTEEEINEIYEHPEEIQNLETKESFLHENNNIHRTLKPDCFLLNKKPNVKITPDLRIFSWFLNYINDIIKTELTTTNYQNYLGFLSIYDINPTLIEKLINYQGPYTSTIHLLINDLFNLSTEMNSFASKTFENTIATIPRKEILIISTLTTIYNKIKNNKIFITRLINDIITYSPFAYLNVTSFIDARGRLYLHSFSYNIQNFALSRAFLKLFSNSQENSLENNWESIKNKIILELKEVNKIPNLNNLENLTYSNYQQQEKKVVQDYIKGLLQKSPTITEIENLPNDPQQLFEYATKNTKKFKKIFEVFSNLWLYKNPNPNAQIITGVDSSSSGYQMTSILLFSENIGHYSNLLGTENKDVYEVAASHASQAFMTLSTFHTKVQEILNIKINQPRGTFILTNENIKELNTFEKRLNTFMTLDFELSSNKVELAHSLKKDLEPYHHELSKLLKYKEFKWLTQTHSIKKIQDIGNLDNHLINFLILLYYSMNYNQIVTNKEIHNDIFIRNLYKLALMTKPYSAGFLKRLETYKETIIQAFLKNNREITPQNTLYLGKLLEKFFIHFINKNLKETEDLLTLAKKLAHLQEPVILDNKYFSITFTHFKTQSYKIKLYRRNQKTKYTLTLKKSLNEIDENKMASSLAPNLIHSMDASVLLNYHHILYNIQEIFHEKQISLSWFTIHDMFFVSTPGLLKLFVAEAYLRLINGKAYIDYIRTTPANLPIITSYKKDPHTQALFKNLLLNPFFVK